MFGKSVNTLQNDIVIDDDSISGTLKYVTGYTGFSGNVSEQSGNYLALKFRAGETAVTTVELVGGSLGHPVTLDSDMNIVIRISDNTTQTIKVVVTEGGNSMIKEYSLTGLTLLAE